MKLTHEITLHVDEKEYKLQVKDLKKSDAKKIKAKQKDIDKKIKEFQALELKHKRLLSQKALLDEEFEHTEDKLALIHKRKEFQLLIEKVEDLRANADLQALDDKQEEVYKLRMELTIQGEEIDEIYKLCEEYGYFKVFMAISEAVVVTEKKS